MHADPAAARAGAILTVDLDAVAANWRLLRAMGRAGERPGGRTADCAAVLKADAYGLGAAPVACRLWQAGCRQFFVAHVEEGIALRRAVPQAQICVLNGLMAGADNDYVEHTLVPALNDLAQVTAWRACAQRHVRALDAVLHQDTGMNRLGLTAAETDILAHDRGRLRGLRLALLMSHLCSSEEADDEANDEQLARFRAFVARMPGAPASLANSSGVFLGPDWHFDLLRPGAALYGLNPTPGLPNPMRPTVELHARILQVRAVAQGEGVGYGRSWRAPRPSRIATVALGYADGFLRSIGGKGHVFVDGRPAPIVGRISMDLITVDVSDFGEHETAPGLAVEAIGPHQSPDDLAVAAGTNGYEIMTALGARYLRRHVGAADDVAPPETASEGARA